MAANDTVPLARPMSTQAGCAVRNAASPECFASQQSGVDLWLLQSYNSWAQICERVLLLFTCLEFGRAHSDHSQLQYSHTVVARGWTLQCVLQASTAFALR